MRKAVMLGALAVGIGLGAVGRVLVRAPTAPLPPRPAVSAVASSAARVTPPVASAPAVPSTPAPAPVPTPSASASPAPPSTANDYGLSSELRPSLDAYRNASNLEDREAPLLDLALSDEPGVLPFLLDELRSSSAADRSQLLEAVIQYRSRDAIPELQRLAAQTSDPAYRSALQDAADYLALPTFTELRRGQLPDEDDSAEPQPDSTESDADPASGADADR